MADNQNNAGLALLAAMRKDRKQKTPDIVERLLTVHPNAASRYHAKLHREAAEELVAADKAEAMLRDEILSLRSRAEKAEAERDEARRKLFPYADATEISGISWDGKYLIGDKKSIAYFHEMKNRGEQIDVYRRAFDERVAAAEATCEKLAAALQPFAKAGQVIDGPFGPALFAEDDMAFQSGCAWSENGVRTTITWGDFRRARSALSAYRNVTTVNASGPKGETPENCRDGGADAQN